MEGTKNSDIRVNNRKRLVNLLFRQGAMTKQEISERLDISLPTATLLLKELLAKGLIEKGDTLDSTGGRKPVELAPVYDTRLAIGMEVSEHEVRMVLMDLGLHVLAKKAWPYGIRYDQAYWEMVNGLLEEFINENVEDPSKLLELGLTLQLPMNENGLIWKKTVPEDKKLNLKMAESCFKGSMNVRNSAKMAAIAQIWTGRQRQDCCFLTIGSYVGGAIIVNREVLDFTGLNGQFGEMISCDGKHNNEILSANALLAKTGVAHADEFFAGLESGDEKITKIWDEYLDVLCRLIFNLHQCFGWKVVIGGATSPYLDRFMPEIYARLSEMEEYFDIDENYVEISDIGLYGAAMGAGMIAIDRFLSEGFNEL